MLQGHVFCSSERQPVCAVVVDQFRDTREDAATLVQCEAQTLNALRLGHNDVHTTLTGPNGTRQIHKVQIHCKTQATVTFKSYEMLKNGNVVTKICALLSVSPQMRLCIFQVQWMCKWG